MAVVIRPFEQRRMRKAHACCSESSMRDKLLASVSLRLQPDSPANLEGSGPIAAAVQSLPSQRGLPYPLRPRSCNFEANRSPTAAFRLRIVPVRPSVSTLRETPIELHAETSEPHRLSRPRPSPRSSPPVSPAVAFGQSLSDKAIESEIAFAQRPRPPVGHGRSGAERARRCRRDGTVRAHGRGDRTRAVRAVRRGREACERPGGSQ